MLKGFLLSYIKYGDNDAILHCFTHEQGCVSLFVRGIYTPKNKKKAYLQPLNELIFNINDNKKSGVLPLVSKIELEKNQDVELNIKINSIIFFISDFLNQILRNETANHSVYKEILAFKNELREGNLQCHLIFLFNFLKIQGLNPLVSEGIYLNPETGRFENTKSHYLFDEETSKFWKICSETEEPYQIKLKSNQRKQFLDGLLVYYHYHFVDFRTPNSLEIVQQIFD